MTTRLQEGLTFRFIIEFSLLKSLCTLLRLWKGKPLSTTSTRFLQINVPLHYQPQFTFLTFRSQDNRTRGNVHHLSAHNTPETTHPTIFYPTKTRKQYPKFMLSFMCLYFSFDIFVDKVITANIQFYIIPRKRIFIHNYYQEIFLTIMLALWLFIIRLLNLAYLKLIYNIQC